MIIIGNVIGRDRTIGESIPEGYSIVVDSDGDIVVDSNGNVIIAKDGSNSS